MAYLAPLCANSPLPTTGHECPDAGAEPFFCPLSKHQWFQQILAHYASDDTICALQTALASVGSELIEWIQEKVILPRVGVVLEIKDLFDCPIDQGFIGRALAIGGHLQNLQSDDENGRFMFVLCANMRQCMRETCINAVI